MTRSILQASNRDSIELARGRHDLAKQAEQSVPVAQVVSAPRQTAAVAPRSLHRRVVTKSMPDLRALQLRSPQALQPSAVEVPVTRMPRTSSLNYVPDHNSSNAEQSTSPVIAEEQNMRSRSVSEDLERGDFGSAPDYTYRDPAPPLVSRFSDSTIGSTQSRESTISTLPIYKPEEPTLSVSRSIEQLLTNSAHAALERRGSSQGA